MEERLPLYFEPNCLGKLDYQRYQPASDQFINCARMDANQDGFGNIVAMVRVSVRKEWVLATGSSIALPNTGRDNITLIKSISNYSRHRRQVSYYGDAKISPTSEIIPWWMILKEFFYHVKVIFHFHLAGNKYLSGELLGILETEEEKPQGRPEIGQEVIKIIKEYFQDCKKENKPVIFPEIIAIKNHGYIILADCLDQAQKIYSRWKEKINQNL